MNTFKVITLVIAFVYSTREQDLNNVCNSIEAYFSDINNNPNCWFDNDLNAAPEQLAANHGFILETHDVKATDGYILTTFRLKGIDRPYGNEVIFLQHGLGASGESFMVNGNNSLAFFLSIQGFDVWIGNFRGSKFSRHESLSRDNPKFWDFSFHEHGLHDLSANLKYINSKTMRKIIYIGHSMGGTSMGIYASMKPKEAQTYVKHAILMAPAFYMRNTKGILSFNYVNNIYELLNYASTINLNVILETNSFERQIFENICFMSLKNARLCINLVEISSGKLPKSLAMERVPKALKVVGNVAMKDALHYAQMIRTGDFRLYDYGPLKNLLVYNTTISPSYNLSKITIPVSLVYFKDDIIATKLDIRYTYEKFGKENWELHELPYNHLSFLIDNSVDKYFFPFLLKVVNKYVF